MRTSGGKTYLSVYFPSDANLAEIKRILEPSKESRTSCSSYLTLSQRKKGIWLPCAVLRMISEMS